jgi:hypothetical protein
VKRLPKYHAAEQRLEAFATLSDIKALHEA